MWAWHNLSHSLYIISFYNQKTYLIFSDYSLWTFFLTWFHRYHATLYQHTQLMSLHHLDLHHLCHQYSFPSPQGFPRVQHFLKSLPIMLRNQKNHDKYLQRMKVHLICTTKIYPVNILNDTSFSLRMWKDFLLGLTFFGPNKFSTLNFSDTDSMWTKIFLIQFSFDLNFVT